MPSTYVTDSRNDRRGVAASPWPAMMPERIGIIGSTQGVKASSRPNPKKLAMIASRLPPEIRLDSRSCSETIGAASLAERRAGRGQLDGHRLGHGRVAEAGVRAALVAHLDLERGGALGACHRDGRAQDSVVHLDVAEELVVLLLAVRHRDVAERKAWRHCLGRGAVAIQVIARRNLPVEENAVGAVGHRGEHESLVHRQELILVGDRPEQSLRRNDTGEEKSEQGEGVPEFFHAGDRLDACCGLVATPRPLFPQPESAGSRGKAPSVFIIKGLQNLITRHPRVLEFGSPIPIISTRPGRVLTARADPSWALNNRFSKEC